MKYFIYVIVIIISFATKAQDYIIEANSNNTILKTIIYPDGQEYIHIENSGLWKDNKGDYGNERCIGIIKKNKLNSNVEVRCEHINQLGEKFWTLKVRNSELHQTGGGVSTYIAVTGKYKKYIGIECPYGVNYIENMVWYTQKCKMP